MRPPIATNFGSLPARRTSPITGSPNANPSTKGAPNAAPMTPISGEKASANTTETAPQKSALNWFAS